jgi:hypothetical protein
MLPRKLIEELIGGCGASRLYILVGLADGIDSVLIILALPLEVVGQRVVERVNHTLPSSARKVLQLRQSLRLERNRVHFLKVEVRHADVNSEAAYFLAPVSRVGTSVTHRIRLSTLACRIGLLVCRTQNQICGSWLSRWWGGSSRGGDGIVWKVDAPGLARFLVGAELQVRLRLVVSEHVEVPRRAFSSLARSVVSAVSKSRRHFARSAPGRRRQPVGLVGDDATVGSGRRLCLQALDQLVMFVTTIVCRHDDDDGIVVERKSKSAIRKHPLAHRPPIESRGADCEAYATSVRARGFLAAISNRVRAAPEGVRRPCSHRLQNPESLRELFTAADLRQ